jgi:ferric-dicitrate binding protein FerR (iron transport regulator)
MPAMNRNADAVAHHEAAVHSRHEAAEQLREINDTGTRPAVIGGALVLVAALIAGATWFLRGSDEVLLARALIDPRVQVTSTNVGQITNVPLADGSTAKLGPESKMRIPPEFGKKVRGLELIGTASFTVAPDKDQRFVVRSGPALITATGTEFAVRNYPAEHMTIVVVREGDVKVTVRDSAHAVASGGGLVVTEDSTVRAATPAEIESLAWVDGIVVLTDQPVRDVLVAFRRWYGVGVFTSDTSILNRRVTMRMPVTSFNEALAALETFANVRKEMQGANVVLRSKRGPR